MYIKVTSSTFAQGKRSLSNVCFISMVHFNPLQGFKHHDAPSSEDQLPAKGEGEFPLIPIQIGGEPLSSQLLS